jgi:hypothetical protein
VRELPDALSSSLLKLPHPTSLPSRVGGSLPPASVGRRSTKPSGPCVAASHVRLLILLSGWFRSAFAGHRSTRPCGWFPVTPLSAPQRDRSASGDR